MYALRTYNVFITKEIQPNYNAFDHFLSFITD